MLSIHFYSFNYQSIKQIFTQCFGPGTAVSARETVAIQTHSCHQGASSLVQKTDKSITSDRNRTASLKRWHMKSDSVKGGGEVRAGRDQVREKPERCLEKRA